MLLIGISWFVFWLLLDVFTVDVTKAALITALIFVILGVLVEAGGVPNLRQILHRD